MGLPIHDIVTVVKWKEVKRAIKYHYPQDKNDYEKLFYQLGEMEQPKQKAGDGETIIVRGGIDSESINQRSIRWSSVNTVS